MNFRISETAEAHLDEIWERIAKDNPTAAREIIEKILDGIQQLTRYPRSGRTGLVKDTRELVVGPYVITYRIVDDVIDIASVIHGRRKRH